VGRLETGPEGKPGVAAALCRETIVNNDVFLARAHARNENRDNGTYFRSVAAQTALLGEGGGEGVQ